jgi:hypothetical protein
MAVWNERGKTLRLNRFYSLRSVTETLRLNGSVQSPQTCFTTTLQFEIFYVLPTPNRTEIRCQLSTLRKTDSFSIFFFGLVRLHNNTTFSTSIVVKDCFQHLESPSDGWRVK